MAPTTADTGAVLLFYYCLEADCTLTVDQTGNRLCFLVIPITNSNSEPSEIGLIAL